MYHIEFSDGGLKPRERLQVEGAEVLSHQELLAILLRTGSKDRPVTQVAQDLLEDITSLSDLDKLSLEEIQTKPGIGRVKAIEIKAMIELGRRIARSRLELDDQILSSEKLGRRLIQEMKHKEQEHLVALYLNTKNQVVRQQTIFIGTLNKSVAEPREILHYAVKYMANAIIIAHNHPSGSCMPSQQDYQLTKSLKVACECVGIILLDHLVIGHDNYYSFREKSDSFRHEAVADAFSV